MPAKAGIQFYWRRPMQGSSVALCATWIPVSAGMTEFQTATRPIGATRSCREARRDCCILFIEIKFD